MFSLYSGQKAVAMILILQRPVHRIKFNRAIKVTEGRVVKHKAMCVDNRTYVAFSHPIWGIYPLETRHIFLLADLPSQELYWCIEDIGIELWLIHFLVLVAL